MESTLKNIKSKTYGIVSDPTYISYSLIGFTTLILGYYVFYDKNSRPGSGEAESAESATSSEGATASSSALGGMFGSSENKGEDAPSEAPSEGASTGIGGMFGSSENKEEVPSENNDAAEPAAGDDANASKPETVGGKRKKTRRQRKQSRKQNKSKTNKSKK